MMATLDTPRVRKPNTITDEKLVRQAQGGSGVAAAALLERCRDSLDRLIAWWSRGRELRAEEREEVRQEADHAFLRAVARFGKRRRKKSKQSRFGTFLNLVVRDHLDKWERRRWRAERHVDRSADCEAVLDRRALKSHQDMVGLAASESSRAGDPAASALWQETWARLAAALQCLDATQRWLLDQRAAGRSLRELSGEGGLSYGKAKRMYRRLIALLRQAVR
jgi:RNA polymerase sigma factor (sigma-70 family)